MISTGKGKKTPSKMGGDRFIPIRNNKQMDVANFLLTKENEPDDGKTTVSSVSGLKNQIETLHVDFFLCMPLCLKESKKAWSVTLNGYNIEDAKILHLGGKPLNAPEGKSCTCTVPFKVEIFHFAQLIS